jgi:excisionase family DNA binding protein
MIRVMENHFDVFMNVKQVSSYLHLNEKKIYAMVSDGKIPATKITGKWLFPKELIDKWMLDSTHNGLLNDRLIISGSDDPLLYRIILGFSESLGSKALISYTPMGTRAGLSLLDSGKVDASFMHWGPEQESYRRHPSLLQQYSRHHDWVLIRAFKREQGLIFKSSLLQKTPEIPDIFEKKFRWSMRQQGSGVQRFLMEVLSKHGLNEDMLNVSATSLSEREAAGSIVLQKSDIASGTRAIANEFGLDFISLGWQAVDFVIPRNIWFRHLFQSLVNVIQSDPTQKLADDLGGYDISQCGQLIWGED